MGNNDVHLNLVKKNILNFMANYYLTQNIISNSCLVCKGRGNTHYILFKSRNTMW